MRKMETQPKEPPKTSQPSDPDDQRYWCMIGGVRFDTRNVGRREELFADLQELARCEYEDVT